VGILNGFALSLLRCAHAGVRHIEKVLQLFAGLKAVEIRQQRAKIQIFENGFERNSL